MRIYQIDALRGFALLGILVVNIFVFHAPYSHYSAFYLTFEGVEAAVVETIVTFFAGKFMFIYAFLFGYSFWLQFEKKGQEQLFKAYWYRRMLILAGFGILHGILYVIGFFLLWKSNWVRQVLYLFTYTGKLSLTNYITQSAICLFIFSGLGYYGQLKPSTLILLVAVIYLFQFIFSLTWLRFYANGPLELLWRKWSKKALN